MKLQRMILVTGLVVAMGGPVTFAARGSKKGSGSSQKNQTPPPPPADTTPPPAPDSTPTTKPAGDLAQAVEAAAKKVTTAFETSADWTSAMAAETTARTDYDAARAAAVAKLKTNPKYQAAAAASEKARKDVENLRNNGGSPDDLSAAADNAMKARSAVSQMELDSTSTDPTLSASKAKLTAAILAMNELRKNEHAAVMADPDWQAAKKAYDDSKVKPSHS